MAEYCELKTDNKTEHGFTHLIKTVEKYVQKGELSAEEAEELLGLIENIRNKVVK